jgi:putative ABC transport system ATP-binding protein
MKAKKVGKEKIIELKNVHKYYGMGDSVVKAVNGVNITINKGDFVAIVGPSGSGKCVSGDTELVLEDGKVNKIKDIEYKKNLRIMGFDKNKGIVKSFKVSKFHKREVNLVLKIKTSSGKEIISTEEHPFFTISGNGFEEIQAKDLKNGFFVSVARKLNIKGKNQELDSLERLSSDKTLIIADSVKLVKRIFNRLEVSRKKVCTELNILPGTYDCWLRNNNIPLYQFRRVLELYGNNLNNYKNDISLTGFCSGHKIKVPLITTEDLLELYGFLAGDGYLDVQSVRVTNLDKEIREKIIKLSKKVFGVVPTETYKTVDIYKSVVKSFFANVFDFPLIRKSWNIKIPDFIFKCSDKEIAGFIRGLFDCDATVSKDKREVSITLASKELIKQLQTLFLRFGIHTRYSEKIKYASNTKQKIKRTYYHLTIPGYDNLRVFKEKIGFNSKSKSKRLNNHIKDKKQNTNIDVIPCGKLIRKLRQDSKIPVIRKIHRKLWNYETEKRNPSREKTFEIINLFEKYGINSSELKKIYNSEIFWDKVVSVEELHKKTEVFDITVPEAENFIANGFIIHNSTMMNLVGALDLATKGDIFLDRTNIEELEESELAQVRGRKIGFVFQTFNLIPTLTALENVMLPMVFQGIPKEDREDRATELLEKIGLGHRLDHLPAELSGGERQRVALSRALANNPEVILADEPTGNLDSKRGEEIAKMFEKLSKEGRTIILVTHDDYIARHAHKIYRLRDGKFVNRKK